MKNKYETPTVKKLDFNFAETVIASGGVKTHASKGIAVCGSTSTNDGKTHASRGPGACGKTHASKGPGICS